MQIEERTKVMAWIFLTLFYGLAKGFREICKKKAMQKFSYIEVLFFYTLFSFLMVLPEIPNAGGLAPRFYIYVAIKAFVIFLSWLLGFKAISKLPLSVFGVLDLSRVLFATLMGVTVLHEVLTLNKTIGLILVCTGLLLLKLFSNKKEDENKDKKLNPLYIIAAFLSFFLSALSGLMDKILMKDMNSSQLQFWYMLFLLLMYVVYCLFKKVKFDLTILKCGYVWALSLLLVLADKALFIANGYPQSEVTVMTLLKQCGSIITILGGKYIFKETNIFKKLIAALVIILGILIGVM